MIFSTTVPYFSPVSCGETGDPCFKTIPLNLNKLIDNLMV